MKESQNNKKKSSLQERGLSYQEMMREVEKDKDLTGEELEEKYKVLSNDWD